MKKLVVLAAWILGGILSVSLVMGVSFLVALRIGRASNQVQVPDVVGKSWDDAVKLAETSDLVIEVAEQRHDEVVPSGHVLQQDPPAGASVRRGRKVRAILSLGGEVIKVPLVVGQASRKAEAEIRQDGLVPGDEAVAPARDAAAGTVVAQVPPPGTPAGPGARVYTLVSSGPEPARWVMPDLTGRTERDVEEWIDACGFRRGAVRRTDTSAEPSGVVVGQLPLSGYPIQARDVVELTVSR